MTLYLGEVASEGGSCAFTLQSEGQLKSITELVKDQPVFHIWRKNWINAVPSIRYPSEIRHDRTVASLGHPKPIGRHAEAKDATVHGVSWDSHIAALAEWAYKSTQRTMMKQCDFTPWAAILERGIEDAVTVLPEPILINAEYPSPSRRLLPDHYTQAQVYTAKGMGGLGKSPASALAQLTHKRYVAGFMWEGYH